MTAKLIALDPGRAAEMLNQGRAVLVDIREADEFARRHVKGAVSRPLSLFEQAHLKLEAGADVIFTCRSGMRTAANCDRLASVVEGEAFILGGGIDAWSAAGLPVEEDRKAPLEMMRQVQIGAGSLVLVGTGLGLAAHPAFFGLAAAVGAGLTFAGMTGFCGMSRVLAFMPWNRQAAA
jgi:rhodanese-related sulfurtransferase